MTGLKFRLLLGSLVAVPLIGINLYAIGAWEHFTRPMADLDPAAESHAPPKILGGIGKGFFDFVTDRRERNRAEAIFDIAEPTQHRVVHWDRRLTIRDVLAEGEPDPGPDLHELYILARAPAMGMTLCPTILESLATGCAVAMAEVDKVGNDGTYRVQVQLGFLPEDAPGDLSDIGTAALETVGQELTPRGRSLEIRTEDRDAFLAGLFDQASRICDQIRAATGTCTVQRVSIKETPIEGGARISAHALFATLKRPGVDLASAGYELAVPEDTDTAQAAPDAPAATPETATPGNTEVAATRPTILNGGGALRGGDGAIKRITVQD